MNRRDLEIAIEVLKERQRINESHLKDVDECCGKLKGRSDAEFRSMSERLTALENNMDDRCKDVKLDLSAQIVSIDEREKALCTSMKKMSTELEAIHQAYRKVTLEFILAVLIGIVALFIHL